MDSNATLWFYRDLDGRKPALPYRQSMAVVEFVGVCYVVSSAYAQEWLYLTVISDP